MFAISALPLWAWSPLAMSVLASLLVLRQAKLASWLRSLVAGILGSLLLWLHPIRDAETGSRNLPAALFWEAGESGDAAKFLNGPKNSLRWGRLYGPIYRIWSGTHTEVVVTRAEHIKAIFHDSDRHFKAKNNDSGWMMSEVLGQCVGLLSGREWASLRSRVEVPFTHKSVLDFLPTIQARTQQYWADLFERKSAGAGAGAVRIHAAEDVKFLPFSLVAALIYGEGLAGDLERQLHDIVPPRERLFKHVIAGGITRFWWSSFLPTEANRLLRRFQKDWLAFNQEAYERARESGDGAPIVSLWEQAQRGEINRTQLLQSLDEVLFANLDVTTGALSWLLVNMASHGAAQARLHSEMVSALGPRGPSDAAALAAYVNAPGTYLAACVAESARVRPVAAFSVPQAPPTDRAAGGYRIPARTSVMVDAYALNMRNPFWGADGAAFRPERWAVLRPSETRYHMWRFGFGPRMCMGRHIAEKMLRVALVQLLWGHELAVVVAAEKKQGGVTVTTGVAVGVDFETDPESWITHPDVKIECRLRR